MRVVYLALVLVMPFFLGFRLTDYLRTRARGGLVWADIVGAVWAVLVGLGIAGCVALLAQFLSGVDDSDELFSPRDDLRVAAAIGFTCWILGVACSLARRRPDPPLAR